MTSKTLTESGEARTLPDEKKRLAELAGKLVEGTIVQHHPHADADELEFLTAFYMPEAVCDARAVLNAVDEYLCG